MRDSYEDDVTMLGGARGSKLPAQGTACGLKS
jgi:hypothetical protein